VVDIVGLSKNIGKVNFWLSCNKIGEYSLFFGYFVIQVRHCGEAAMPNQIYF